MPRFAPYGYSRSHFNVSIPIGAGLNSTGQVNVMLSHNFGFQYEIEKVKAIWTVAGAGAGATRTINIRKGNATGTVVATAALALAGSTVANVVDVPVTAANAVFGDADNLTIEFASGGTVYSAGELTISILYRDKAQRVN